MGTLERIGESRAESMSRKLLEQDHRIDVHRDIVNRQGRTVQLLADAFEQHANEYQGQYENLLGRVEELETELRFRLLPFWRRWFVTARWIVGYALGWLHGALVALRERLELAKGHPCPACGGPCWYDAGAALWECQSETCRQQDADDFDVDPDFTPAEVAALKQGLDDVAAGDVVTVPPPLLVPCENCGQMISADDSAEAGLVNAGAHCEYFHCSNRIACHAASLRKTELTDDVTNLTEH